MIINFAFIAASCLVADLLANLAASSPADLTTVFGAQLVALISAYSYLNAKNLQPFIEKVCRVLKAAARCWSASKEEQR